MQPPLAATRGSNVAMAAMVAVMAVMAGVCMAASPHARYNPVANPEAVVVAPHGATRFTVLTSRLIRMEYAQGGAFEDAATFTVLHRHLPVPQFYSGVESLVDSNGEAMRVLIIRTSDVELMWVLDGGSGWVRPCWLVCTSRTRGQRAIWAYPCLRNWNTLKHALFSAVHSGYLCASGGGPGGSRERVGGWLACGLVDTLCCVTVLCLSYYPPRPPLLLRSQLRG